MDVHTRDAKQVYETPVLTPRGEVTTETLGSNPITPKEAVDLLGFDRSI